MSRPTLIFKGEDGSECEQFIQAIRQHAFAEGKSRDGEWIVDFAATCFTGSALRWYETLSSEAQSDWDLLRNAMLSQYPIEAVNEICDGSSQVSHPVDVSESLAIYRGPAIVPNMRTGRILVDSQPRILRGYISRLMLSNGTHQVTKEPSEALYVRFVPSDDLCDMWLVNSSTGSELLGISFKSSLYRFILLLPPSSMPLLLQIFRLSQF